MLCHFRNEYRRARFQWLDHATHDRNTCRADFLAFVARHAVEDAGLRERPPNFVGIVAWVKRCLSELDQRCRAGKVGDAADAVERLRCILHLPMQERFGKAGIGYCTLDPWLEAHDFALERRSIDDESADHRQVTERFDRHVMPDRCPAAEHLPPRPAHRAAADGAGTARLRAAEPGVCEIYRVVLGDPVERVEHAHRFLVWDSESLDIRTALALEPTNPHRQRVADYKPRIARLERVVALDLAEPARLVRPEGYRDNVHHGTSRLFLSTKTGWKNGSS